MDPLAPNRDAFWSAIDERLAAIDQGLTWLDLAQARLALQDLSGSLRMLGLADIAALAETLSQGFQADPRHPDRLTELASLKAAVQTAKAGGGDIPIVAASQKRCLLVVSAEPAIAGLAREQPGWRRIVARDTVSASVWLRRGDIHAVLLDPDVPGDVPGWLDALPAALPLAFTAETPPAGSHRTLPAPTPQALRDFLAGL
jgi:HPt (histidine-containing phosphotransfer) domain-containing protein